MDLKSLQKSKEAIKKQLKSLDIKTIELLVQDHSKALKYIRIGRKVTNGSDLSDEEAESVANELQEMAKMELSQRSSKVK